MPGPYWDRPGFQRAKVGSVLGARDRSRAPGTPRKKAAHRHPQPGVPLGAREATGSRETNGWLVFFLFSFLSFFFWGGGGVYLFLGELVVKGSCFAGYPFLRSFRSFFFGVQPYERRTLSTSPSPRQGNCQPLLYQASTRLVCRAKNPISLQPAPNPCFSQQLRSWKSGKRHTASLFCTRLPPGGSCKHVHDYSVALLPNSIPSILVPDVLSFTVGCDPGAVYPLGIFFRKLLKGLRCTFRVARCDPGALAFIPPFLGGSPIFLGAAGGLAFKRSQEETNSSGDIPYFLLTEALNGRRPQIGAGFA